MSRDRIHLDPGTHVRVRAVEAAMEAYGYPLLITCTYRPVKTQLVRYAQGRTAPGKIVTNAKRGWHNIRKNGKPASRAVDFAFKKQRRFPGRGPWSMEWPWDRLRRICAACDLTRTLSWDLGHMVDKRKEKFSDAWKNSDQA
jgi:hypothetical protein